MRCIKLPCFPHALFSFSSTLSYTLCPSTTFTGIVKSF